MAEVDIKDKSKKNIDFHPFCDKQKSWLVWDYDQEWHSIF
jgi:hypothetical protein